MSQTYDVLKPISGTTKFSELYQIIRDHFEALRSGFSGVSAPSSPIIGQHFYNTSDGKEYVYTSSSGWSEVVNAAVGLGTEIVNARGTLPTMDQRLDVSHNEDGTLKASTSLNPSQWYVMTAASGVISTTQFRLYGADGTAIYYPTRRLKINRSSGGNAFTEVVSSSYGAPNTTVTVRDAVISNLINVEHSIIGPRKDAAGDGAVSYEMVGNRKIVTTSATSYTVQVGDSVVMATYAGGAAIAGPTAASFGAGRTLYVMNTGSGSSHTYTPNGSEKINGSSSPVSIYKGTQLGIITDGSNWFKIDQPVSITGCTLATPWISNPQLFETRRLKAYRNTSTQSLTNGIETAVIWNGIGSDPLSGMNTSTGYYTLATTPICSGYWHVSGQVRVATTGAISAALIKLKHSYGGTIDIQRFEINPAVGSCTYLYLPFNVRYYLYGSYLFYVNVTVWGTGTITVTNGLYETFLDMMYQNES